MPLSNTVQFSQPLKDAILARQSWPESGKARFFEEEAEEERDNLIEMEPERLQSMEDEAYRRGLKDGKSQAASDNAELRQQVVGEIQATLESLRKEREQLAGELQALLPDLIIEGVGRVLYGYQPDGETIRGIVGEILQGFDSDDSQMRLMLNPTDLENLMTYDAQLADSYPELRLIANKDFSRGECLLEGRFGIADARYASKLSNLRKVLE